MRALDGMLVLDFSHALAGPFCAYHLALLGADVIKIERPGTGDDMRHYVEHAGQAGMSAPFLASNMAKRSITLDLSRPEASEIIRRMALRADVAIENFRPGVAAKLGVDPASLRAINPRLVHCSITGFGQNGPMRDWPAYDHIVQAISGVAMINGEPDQGPLKVGIPVSDIFSGFLGAQAIVAALLRRERGGEGQELDVAMLDATFVLMAQMVASSAMTGKPPRRTGNRGFRLVATSDTYRTSDGHLSIGANHQAQIEAMFRVLGAPELLADARFADHESRMRNNDALHATLTRLFATRSAAELESLLAAAKVPAGRVRALTETMAERQIAERGVLIEARVPGGGDCVRVVGAGYRATPDGPRERGAVPALGEHTEEILARFGFTANEIADLRARSVI